MPLFASRRNTGLSLGNASEMLDTAEKPELMHTKNNAPFLFYTPALLPSSPLYIMTHIDAIKIATKSLTIVI